MADQKSVEKESKRIFDEARKNDADYERIIRQGNDVLRQRNEKLARHVEYLKKKNMIVPPFRIDPSKYSSVTSNSMAYYYMDGFEPIALNVRPATCIQPIPPMISYLKVNTNIRAPDEKILHNYPSTYKDNSKLIKELAEVYDGVHGEGREHPTSEMFVKLVDSLENNQPTSSSSTSTMPRFQIFEAVSKYFVDFGTADELYDKYVSLNPHKCIMDKNPNSDGPEAENVTAEKALHSYQTMFCRKCYMYDCVKHLPSERPKMPYLEVKYLCSQKMLPNKPCSPECYLTMPGMVEEGNKRRKKIFNNAFENTKKQHERNIKKSEILECCRKYGATSAYKEDKSTLGTFNIGLDCPEWSPGDLTLFRVLQKVFADNYCVLATFLITKNCTQVYTMSKKEKTVDTSFYLHINEPPVRRPKIQLKTNEGNLFFHPVHCDHPGRKCDSRCECVEKQSVCEKFCNCDPKCPYRFQGCRCIANCDTTQCICFKYARECDPDLCKGCKSGEFQMDSNTFKCNNVNMQRGLNKPLLLAPSDVSGWGIFLQNAVKKFAFISEYCGELISHSEAERRGVIYDFKKMSFLFNLDSELVIDATKKGSLVRFANHKSKPNCYVKIHKVNGDYRIGIYANENIEAGKELFISYEYNDDQKKKYNRVYQIKNEKKKSKSDED